MDLTDSHGIIKPARPTILSVAKFTKCFRFLAILTKDAGDRFPLLGRAKALLVISVGIQFSVSLQPD